MREGERSSAGLDRARGCRGGPRSTAAVQIKDGLWEEWRMTDTGGMVVERDLMAPARDGVLLATDVYRPKGPGPLPGALGAHALRQIGSEPIRAHRSGRRAAVAGRCRRLFRQARLCGRLPGLPRPLSFGRPFYEIPERSRGRFRHARL